MIAPLLLRVSRSRGWSSTVLFLAKEHAGHLYPRAAGRHLPDTERDPSPESPLDCLGAHQSDDRLAVFGYGELTGFFSGTHGKESPFYVG